MAELASRTPNTSFTDRIIGHVLNIPPEQDPERELMSINGRREYLTVFQSYREEVKTYPDEQLPQVKHSWYRIIGRRADREHKAAVELTTKYWSRRIEENLEGISSEPVSKKLIELRPIEHLDSPEVHKIRRLTRQHLKSIDGEDEVHKEIMYTVGKVPSFEQLSYRQANKLSRNLMAVQETWAEGIALGVGVAGAVLGTWLVGEPSLSLTFLGGNLPSWVALIPLMFTTAAMAEKHGYCPNILSTYIHNFSKNASLTTRILGTASGVFVWEFGFKDLLFNLVPLAGAALNLTPVINNIPGSAMQWFFIVNGAAITCSHLVRSAWCWNQSKKTDK